MTFASTNPLSNPNPVVPRSHSVATLPVPGGIITWETAPSSGVSRGQQLWRLFGVRHVSRDHHGLEGPRSPIDCPLF
jgi:hypothetical protein